MTLSVQDLVRHPLHWPGAGLVRLVVVHAKGATELGFHGRRKAGRLRQVPSAQENEQCRRTNPGP